MHIETEQQPLAGDAIIMHLPPNGAIPEHGLLTGHVVGFGQYATIGAANAAVDRGTVPAVDGWIVGLLTPDGVRVALPGAAPGADPEPWMLKAREVMMDTLLRLKADGRLISGCLKVVSARPQR